jgi:hypothetical protein
MRGVAVALMLVAAPMALPPAHAQGSGARYEPSQRMRLLEGCMKDEVANGPNCVKRCQADFRLDLNVRPPVCIATKTDARYTPPKPEYQAPATPPPPGKPGL